MVATKTLRHIFKKDDFRVTIFGSSRAKKGGWVYDQVFDLAKMIGQRDIDIVTGGGPGIMKAANVGHRKGAKMVKSSAHSIGLSVKLPHEQGTNKGVTIEKKFTRFSRRLDNFMSLSNAIVVAPGGIGTTLELFYAWQLVQVKHVCHIPIILLGDMWKPLIKWVENHALDQSYISKEDLKLVFLAKDANQAIKMIDTAYKEFKSGTKNYCLNYEKYKLY